MSATQTTPTTTTIWNIDPVHSNVEFSVKHMMVSTVKGRFGALEGTLTFDEAAPAQAAVNATIEISSIQTGDPNRDAHLRAADFFEVEKWPTATFRGTRVEAQETDRARVYGGLTIRDVTREVVLDVEYDGQVKDAYGMQRAAFTAETTINRSDFGLTWNPLLETGGAVVSDRVRITLHIAATRQD